MCLLVSRGMLPPGLSVALPFGESSLHPSTVQTLTRATSYFHGSEQQEKRGLRSSARPSIDTSAGQLRSQWHMSLETKQQNDEH